MGESGGEVEGIGREVGSVKEIGEIREAIRSVWGIRGREEQAQFVGGGLGDRGGKSRESSGGGGLVMFMMDWQDQKG